MIVVFLLEEPSMKDFLTSLFQRLSINPDSYKLISYEGKSDLKKGIPIKLKSWKIPNSQFFILMDNDNKPNCKAEKQILFELCQQAKHPDTVIRLVCQELETWYLGDLDKISLFYNQPLTRNILKKASKGKVQVDELQKPSNELEEQFPCFNKSALARYMGANITLVGNTSVSFGYFLQALRTVFPTLEATLKEA